MGAQNHLEVLWPHSQAVTVSSRKPRRKPATDTLRPEVLTNISAAASLSKKRGVNISELPDLLS